MRTRVHIVLRSEKARSGRFGIIIEETGLTMASTEGGDGPQTANIKETLKEVLKTALFNDGVCRGLREAVKALDKRQAQLCVLAKDCDEAGYVRLIEALCNLHQIKLLKVEQKAELGEWVGLCKIDREGKPRKVVKCSCVVVKDIGMDSEAWSIVQEYIKAKGGAA